MAASETLKEWKVAITSVEQGYKSMDEQFCDICQNQERII